MIGISTARYPIKPLSALGRSGSRKALLALAVVWLPILAYFAPLLQGAIPWDPDVATTFLPFKILGIAMIRSGHLPLWTPLVELGFPVLAEGQGGLLYPPDVLLFLTLPPYRAFAVSVVGHALLGSGLMYALARRFGRSRAAAIVAALVFGFAGPLLPLAGTPRMEVAAWWPALLLAVDGIVQAKLLTARARWLVFGAFSTALLHLAGHPQLAIMGLLLAGIVAIYRSGTLPRREQVDALGWCLATVLLGSGLAAPQLLATLDIVSQSQRAAGAGALAGQGSLFPPGLVEIVSPNWSFAATLGSESPNAYVGVMTLALGWLALTRRRTGARFWAGVALAMTLLAFGRFTPLFEITSHLPVFAYFRAPGRFLYIVTTALAMLGALGLDTLRDQSGERATPLIRAGVALATLFSVANVAGGLVVSLLGNRLVTVASTLTGVATTGRGAKWQHLLVMATDATSASNARFLAPIFGFVGVIALVFLVRRRARAAVAVAVAMLLVEFWVGAPRVALGVPRRPTTVDVVRGLGSGRIYSFGDPFTLAVDERHDLLPANENAAYGIASIGLYDPLGNVTYRDLLEPLGAVNLSYGAVEPTLGALRANRRLLDLFGVVSVLSQSALDDSTLGFTLIERTGDASIYRNPNAFPRAWVVGSLQTTSGDVRAALLSPTRDLRKVALVSGATSPVHGIPGPARITRDQGDEIDVRARGPGVLVLADRWAPGWRATVDGTNAPILRVDGVLRGVVLSEGQHDISFRYWPDAFGRGIVIAIVALTIIVGICVLSGHTHDSVSNPARPRDGAS